MDVEPDRPIMPNESITTAGGEVPLDDLRKIIVCPECGQKLAWGQGDWSCPVGHRGEIDRRGIVHLAKNDYYYREVPRSFFDVLSDSLDDAEAKKAILKAIDSLTDKQRDKMVAYALDQRRGGAAILGRCQEGRTVLDFGCGWGNLSMACARLGAKVVSVDMTYESLLFNRILEPNDKIIRIKAGQHHRLPFGDGVFDTIFLNGVLEWIPEGYNLDKNPRLVQLEYLREFRRILKPDGLLVTGIENRLSFMYLLGQPEDHTGLRFGALLPRWLSDKYSKIIRHKPYRTYTYTRAGYKKLLTDAGFSQPTFYVPFPRYRYWHHLVRADKFSQAKIISSLNGKRWILRFASMIFRAWQRSGALLNFVQDYYLVTSPESGRVKTGTIDSVLSAQSEYQSEINEIQVSTTQTLVFSSNKWVYKVPLSSTAEARLRREIQALNEIRSTDLNNLIVPEFKWLENPNRAIYTRLSGQPAKNNDANDRKVIVSALDRLSREDRYIELKETQAFARWKKALEIRSLPNWLDQRKFLGVLEKYQSVKVTVGRVHGDLVPSNVIITPSGKYYLIDWDRYESFSPRFLDTYLISDINLNVKSSVQTAKNELRLPWAIEHLLYIFDRIEKDSGAYAHPLFIPSSWNQKNKLLWLVAWSQIEKKRGARYQPLGLE